MSLNKKALALHQKLKGKISTNLKPKVLNKDTLSLLYSPGVAEPCIAIAKDKHNLYKYTIKDNTIAIISNGTAVLGLGNIGADASLPVMEGKALLVKHMANVNAFPICINEQDPDKFIEIVKKITSPFGAINLEDIKAPECFYIEDTLKKELDIPVFHDDQHGTAIVVLAALTNALKLVKKDKSARIVLNGNGAAGHAIYRLLEKSGFKNIVVLNKDGVIKVGSKNNNVADVYVAKNSISNKVKAINLSEAIIGADIFIGVSIGNVLTANMTNQMNAKPIVFALANPLPEMIYEEYKKSNVFIYATGRSDLPNQINNLLAFPSVMKLMITRKIKNITDEDKLKIATLIANAIPKNKLSKTFIVPNPLDKSLVLKITKNFK